MNQATNTYNGNQSKEEQEICDFLANAIDTLMPKAENKIWHRHPVWFLEGNPIVGYSKIKAGIRLMFWSGASFEEAKLKPGTGKFKDASKLYTSKDEIDSEDLRRWLLKSEKIQWDYKNIYKRKGKLVRID